MTIIECTTIWAMNFQEPLKKKLPNGQEIENPKLLNIQRWLRNHFGQGKELGSFCYYLIDNFIPTSVNPYPSAGHCTEQYRLFMDSNSTFNGQTYTPIDFEEAQKIYAEKNDVRYDPPEGMEDIDISILTKDNETLTRTEMLKKYGILLCGELWSDGFYSRAKVKLRETQNIEMKQFKRVV